MLGSFCSREDPRIFESTKKSSCKRMMTIHFISDRHMWKSIELWSHTLYNTEECVDITVGLKE